MARTAEVPEHLLPAGWKIVVLAVLGLTAGCRHSPLSPKAADVGWFPGTDVARLAARIDWGGHWAVAVGYDDRQNDDPRDDVLILADPYDRYDDVRDGYTFVNANRFYWMWFDTHYFDRETWRAMIAVRLKASR